jgi:pSer/pThr/pTyr-binding forkhead associated (FHA) protein
LLVRMSRGAISARTTALKTKTQPEAERDVFFEGPDPITWLHIAGTASFYEVPRKKTCSLGSSSKNDIVIKAPYISRRHCTLTRLYDGVRVEDNSSKNGTFADHRSAEKEPRDVPAGKTFTAGGITFLALNDAMHAAFPTLSDVLDWEDGDPFTPAEPGWATPSTVTVWGAGTEHLLIIGPRGCGHDRLADAIHSISPMREKSLVRTNSVPTDRAGQRELLLRAQKTTLVLTITDDTPKVDSAFASMLFSPSYRIRIVVCAPSFDRAQQVLGQEHTAMRRIELRPLAFRTDQLIRILDRLLAADGSPLRFDKLRKPNQEALMACEWRRNLDDLHTAAVRLAAVHKTRSLRQAAGMLGIKNFNVLQKWFTDTMKLTLPLAGDRAVKGEE